MGPILNPGISPPTAHAHLSPAAPHKSHVGPTWDGWLGGYWRVASPPCRRGLSCRDRVRVPPTPKPMKIIDSATLTKFRLQKVAQMTFHKSLICHSILILKYNYVHKLFRKNSQPINLFKRTYQFTIPNCETKCRKTWLEMTFSFPEFISRISLMRYLRNRRTKLLAAKSAWPRFPIRLYSATLGHFDTMWFYG